MGEECGFCITTGEDFIVRKSIWRCFSMLLRRVSISWLSTDPWITVKMLLVVWASCAQAVSVHVQSRKHPWELLWSVQEVRQ